MSDNDLTPSASRSDKKSRKPKQKRRKSLNPITFKSNQTEIENSRRFAADHGERIGYVPQWKQFVVFTSKRWELDVMGHAFRLAKQTASQILCECVESGDLDAIRFGTHTASARGIEAMLKLSRDEIAMDYQQFDADPFLLNVQNGTVDLRTGILKPHNRADLLTKICPAAYDPDVETFEWDRFVESLFSSDSEIEYLQRFAGYCLTGDVREHVLNLFWGDGANGKSTLVEALMHTLGPDYSMSAPSEMLMESRSDRHPTEKADLFGKRLVVASETEANRTLAESMVKQLTGGDTIRARRMHENFWQFSPTHKLILLTNNKPIIKGQDHGIWRRIRLVPFVKQFWDPAKGESGSEELKADKELPSRLREMRDVILSWAVAGCVKWQQLGLGMSEPMQEATDDYRDESNVLGRFVRDCCVQNEALKIRGKALNEAIESYCSESGDSKPNAREVKKWMERNGFQSKKNNGVWYCGLGLKYEQELQ